jgi:hypothetical protein
MIGTSSEKLALAVLDTIESRIAIIDRKGVISYVNQSWINYGQNNGLPSCYPWRGINYLSACRTAAEAGDKDGAKIFDRIKHVIEGHSPSFSYEYPCHSPTEPLWFMMQVLPVRGVENSYVVSHHRIAEPKQAEIESS